MTICCQAWPLEVDEISGDEPHSESLTQDDPKEQQERYSKPGMGCTAAQNHKLVTLLMTVQICSNSVFALNSAPYLAHLGSVF